MTDTDAIRNEIAWIEHEITEMEFGLDAARLMLAERLALLRALQETGIPPTASIH
jgi:hypothetical protein